MILNDVISARFFLVFSPIFIMYASHYAQHLRDGDDRSGVQGGPGDGELRLPGDADGQGHLLHLVHVYAS